MNTWLICKFQIPGFHRWAEAPDSCAYLSNWHRHEFFFTVEMRVKANRAYEFITVKDEIHSWLIGKLGAKNYTASELIEMGIPYANDMCIVLGELIDKQSVEGLGEYVATYVKDSYEINGVKVTVMEDNENGARVEDI